MTQNATQYLIHQDAQLVLHSVYISMSDNLDKRRGQLSLPYKKGSSDPPISNYLRLSRPGLAIAPHSHDSRALFGFGRMAQK